MAKTNKKNKRTKKKMYRKKRYTKRNYHRGGTGATIKVNRNNDLFAPSLSVEEYINHAKPQAYGRYPVNPVKYFVNNDMDRGSDTFLLELIQKALPDESIGSENASWISKLNRQKYPESISVLYQKLDNDGKSEYDRLISEKEQAKVDRRWQGSDGTSIYWPADASGYTGWN